MTNVRPEFESILYEMYYTLNTRQMLMLQWWDIFAPTKLKTFIYEGKKGKNGKDAYAIAKNSKNKYLK
jgi:hypothetical protein